MRRLFSHINVSVDGYIAELTWQDGRDLALFAGARAAQTAVRPGVLKLRLIINPVLLGGGTRLFDARIPKDPHPPVALRGPAPHPRKASQ